MPDIILPNLGLELPDVGSDQDTWGDILNANLEILDNAVTYDAITKTLGAVDVTLTTAEAAHGVINLNGTLTANVNLIVPVSPVRLYLVNNGTTGAFTVAVKTAAGSGVTVNQGANTLVYSDGTNIVQGATSVNGSFAAGTVNAGTLNVSGNAIITGALSSGAASFAAGTAALPSITATGDLNTGRWYPAADTIAESTGGVERLRITAGGYFRASNTGTYGGVAGVGNLSASTDHVFQSNQNAAIAYFISSNTGATVAGTVTALPTGATGVHHVSLINGTAVYQVLANGNVQNTNNSYGAISDAKLKENITDASSYLDRFMQVRFRNFNFIGSDLKQFGVIAQELEAVFPGLIEETPDTEQVTKTRTVEVPAVTDEEGNEVTPATTREEEYTESVPTGTFTKSVKYSVLALMAGKVIQEQQATIQAQQAQIDSILTRLAALEAK